MRGALAPQIEAFAARLDAAPPSPPSAAGGRAADRRAPAPARRAAAPLHVGLHAPNKQGGVILTSVPSVHFADAADKEKQLDYLATRLYGGGGSHGVFSKTVGAGLAYSNGLRGSVSSGRIGYYAERTPELPQTVRFVIGVVKDGQRDPRLGDYVMAQAFGESRASQTYEARAEGIAADLADGQPPEQVRALPRRDPGPAQRPAASSTSSTSARTGSTRRLLPGYDAKGLDRADGSFFVIGPDKQLDAWEQYLRERRRPGRAPAAALRARLLDAADPASPVWRDHGAVMENRLRRARECQVLCSEWRRA